ncbi:hypothetical protein NECAME_18619, partial [Necator americanus]
MYDVYSRNESVEDPVDALEVFELIRDINDPEHPYTLEQLNVVQEELIHVFKDNKHIYVDVRAQLMQYQSQTPVGHLQSLCMFSTNRFGLLRIAYSRRSPCTGVRKVRFTPTIPHCTMATLIGLAIRVKLVRSLHPKIK